MSRSLATALGTTAILMWALLALFTAASGEVPPFQLAALTFTVGTAIGFIWLWAKGRFHELRQPLSVWVFGTVGLFGYHALYFTALRNAPPVEAGLIAYLWPLLIVVFSALLPGEKLRWYHLVGALLGLSGTVLIVTRGESLSFDPRYTLGYVAALGCALTWSSYSVLSRRLASVPTGIVAGYCGTTAIGAAIAHLLFETTVWPADGGEWLAVLGLGLMPVGAAFYVWDIGVKRGDIQLLGVTSYAAPLLSTIILIAAGYGVLTPQIAVAALLITGGALLAARGGRFSRQRPGSKPASASSNASN
ncbi:EamA family transporter [Afifella sp. JA880]|uniref:aromatic amino acid exporter YddG n=1 Tax=Afifella sp. JA880 TaxID=2975280 RepID=UPI0021BA9495|nr:EamA family transporter [Afifella sp. JA880]MCT8268406.1 EamA family transporter [Afifella sp. JA880]